jgi:predicted PurR-regulated permease PerM
MLGIDTRTFKVVWTIFLFVLMLATIYAIHETLILLAVATFFAYMLAPLVNLVERVTPKRRAIALAIVYVLMVVALVTVGVNLGSQIAEEATNFLGGLPKLVQQGKLTTLPMPSWLEPLRDRIMVAAQHEAAQLQTSIVPLLQRASGSILSGISVLVLVVLVPIISFFLLKDAREIRAFLVFSLGDFGNRALVKNILSDIHLLLSKYIRALVLLAFTSFAAWGLFLYATKAPYPMLLAGLSGALEFIPGVGPAVALATVLIVCGAVGYPFSLIWLLVFWGVFRLFQDYVLTPLLMSAGINLHPLLILLGVLAGGQLGGIPGLLFSVPAIAILKVLFTRLHQAEKHETSTSESILHKSSVIKS